MHCPRCGTTATTNKQFCRGCGLSLEKIAEILGEEPAIQSSSSNTDAARLRERQKKFENLAGIAGMTTFGMVLVTLIVIVVLKMILAQGLALVSGRDFVVPDDIKSLAVPVLSHRVVGKSFLQAGEFGAADAIIRDLVDRLRVPS